MTLRAGLLALLLGSTMLAGCGGPSAVAPSSTGTSPPLATTTDHEAITDLVGFTSPSGNVGCYLEPRTVRCDVRDRDWNPPPRPADCEFDYGQGIDLSVGQMPRFVCAGDTALGGGSSLPYGTSVSAGSLTCESAETGITCRDSTTAHGFTIARETFRLF